MRIARADDLQTLYEMAKLTGGGFTNLPPDRASLSAKLERTEKALARTSEGIEDELIVMVLENVETGQVRGTCQIFSTVGQNWPFYSYRLGMLTQHSRELGRTFRAQMLSLTTDLEGSVEVGGLFLHPRERAEGLGLLLARSRYLYIRNHRARFGDRVIAELRGRGHHDAIYIHGALERMCALYQDFGVELGALRPATGVPAKEMRGHIILSPPSALNDRWSRRLPDPITAMASGWMRVRQRARQKNVELPLVISDHADWDELTDTIREVAPNETWITHGREEALLHWCMTHQIRARALALVGREDEDEG